MLGSGGARAQCCRIWLFAAFHSSAHFRSHHTLYWVPCKGAVPCANTYTGLGNKERAHTRASLASGSQTGCVLFHCTACIKQLALIG